MHTEESNDNEVTVVTLEDVTYVGQYPTLWKWSPLVVLAISALVTSWWVVLADSPLPMLVTEGHKRTVQIKLVQTLEPDLIVPNPVVSDSEGNVFAAAIHEEVSLVALSGASGKRMWEISGACRGYASPIIAKAHSAASSEQHDIVYHATACGASAHEARTGIEIWSTTWPIADQTMDDLVVGFVHASSRDQLIVQHQSGVMRTIHRANGTVAATAIKFPCKDARLARRVSWLEQFRRTILKNVFVGLTEMIQQPLDVLDLFDVGYPLTCVGQPATLVGNDKIIVTGLSQGSINHPSTGSSLYLLRSQSGDQGFTEEWALVDTLNFDGGSISVVFCDPQNDELIVLDNINLVMVGISTNLQVQWSYKLSDRVLGNVVVSPSDPSAILFATPSKIVKVTRPGWKNGVKDASRSPMSLWMKLEPIWEVSCDDLFTGLSVTGSALSGPSIVSTERGFAVMIAVGGRRQLGGTFTRLWNQLERYSGGISKPLMNHGVLLIGEKSGALLDASLTSSQPHWIPPSVTSGSLYWSNLPLNKAAASYLWPGTVSSGNFGIDQLEIMLRT